ncbi:flagellar motor protein MotB [Polynucleobacter sp. MWH-Mekk-B1]|uniref:flagellar motor protein MotB n=1 Tax=Polynucleobacter finlandensis TaxID=1855894 RepID=UPI001C0C5F88|nr:flagellar motor protein MotB [Polynucleobacter finlandensis]MBU3545140.1 flagellar motor protein MotB [Polynucleobacter finlandensis]
MAKADEKPSIVVKKIKKVAAGHHGGAWKIAYADFVTAMMAFFLLMWLLGSTAQGDLQGIAEYFKTPLKVALAGGTGAGSADSILNGGGKDLTKKDGEVNKNSNVLTQKTNVNISKAEQAKAELEVLKQLKAKIQAAIDADPKLSKFRNQLLLDLTQDGLRIQIVDEKNRPMFDKSKAELQPYARDLLRLIGKTLNGVNNKISLSGHTDPLPYPNGEKSYSNWELSADRANASRRELVYGGMDEKKILQVLGVSSAIPLDKKDPLNPVNRRISIIIMNKGAEERVERDGAVIEAASAEEVDKAAKGVDSNSRKQN